VQYVAQASVCRSTSVVDYDAQVPTDNHRRKSDSKEECQKRRTPPSALAQRDEAHEHD